MGQYVNLTDVRLSCYTDLDCNTKVLNSYCDRQNTSTRSCVCERGYKYYSKFNKCVFSNHFHCSNVQQCANLDPRLTCVDNYCTCKEKELRADNYLCSAFRKYCYKGYRYNAETTDCVFVGDLRTNQLGENLDQSVEIFVIVLFFITSALFIASCINNYRNERKEKLRRRIAQQQTMQLFSEQRRRIDFSPSSASIGEVVSFANDNLFTNHQLRNGSRQNLASPRAIRQFRFQQHMIDLHMKAQDLPPSYEECMKNEQSKFYSNPLSDFAIVEINEQQNFNLTNNNLNDLANQSNIDQCCLMTHQKNHLKNSSNLNLKINMNHSENLNNRTDNLNNLDNTSNNLTSSSGVNTINENDENNNVTNNSMQPVNKNHNSTIT